MERIKKALELAREQREALEKAKSLGGESAAAVAKQPEAATVRNEKSVHSVTKPEPPVLTEVVDRVEARAVETPPARPLNEVPAVESPRSAPSGEATSKTAASASHAATEPEQHRATSDRKGFEAAGSASSAVTEAPEPEATHREQAAALPQTRQKKERVAPLKSAVPSDIQYSQTRRVDVSAEKMESNRLIAGIKDHPQSDLFRVLRTKILHRMRVEGITSLAVTSPTKGAGKSMVSANLAVSLAMEANQTVMLVDLDLRKPAISRYFGIEAQQGVADYLIDSAELPGLLVHPGIERLVLLPAGNPVPQSSELLSTPRMSHLVEDITNRYASRIVLFDLPPLLHLDDALIFLPQVQSSILVVEEGVNTAAEVEQSLMLLEKSNLLGTVYNKARQTKHLPY
jgi:capsular exopolysaccharide synthesis family protein